MLLNRHADLQAGLLPAEPSLRKWIVKYRLSRTAFTLIELLVVISIIALLVAILLPALQSAREVTKGAVCLSNQRQLSTAMATWQADHDAYFPNYYHFEFFSGTSGDRLLWGDALEDYDYLGLAAAKLLTCPSFDEGNELPNPANPTWASYNTTHYGYNHKNIGSSNRATGNDKKPANESQIASPSETYVTMDSVRNFTSITDEGAYVVADTFGSQFYPAARHGGETHLVNIAYADGHSAGQAIVDPLLPYNDLGTYSATVDNMWDRQ